MRTGHLGPTVFRSDRRRRHLVRGRRPPAFHSGERLARSLRAVFWLTPGHADQPGVWYAGGSPQGLFRTEDAGRHLGTGRRLERPPDVGDLVGVPRGEHAGRLDAALGHRRPPRPRPPLPRPVRGRHLREHRRGPGLVHPEPGRRGRVPARAGRRLRPRSALPAHAPRRPRPALPPEPLRHLPPRPTGDEVGAHRRQHAHRGRRHRLPRRAPPPRPGHGLGLPDGRHRRLAPDQSRRPARGVRHPRRRGQLDPPGQRAYRRRRGSRSSARP